MLKLTNSFCRYLKFTCKNIYYYRIHVKSITYLSSRRKTLGNTIENTQNTLCAIPVVHIGQQLRLFANIKKRHRLKRLPTNLNEPKKNKQMSESFPTLNHVSCGGQFEISDDENTPERRNQFRDSGSNTSKKESGAVPPDFRVWETVVKKNDTVDGHSFKFKLLSYNVLAQYLLESHPYLYTECSPNNLKWQVRAARLYDEITKLAPDILCLQEVQVTHLNTFYSKFEEIGYVGVFKQKTGHRGDGCAIYFKQSLFEMQDHFSVEFYQPELPVLNRDNIGIMVKLLPRNYHGLPVVVATTHLLYNPRRTDVRLAQIQVFLAEIDRFAFYNNERESGHLPIILTGDLNSTPDSAVIKLLDRGHVSSSPFRDNSDWKKIGVTDNCQHLSVFMNRQRGRETDFCMTKIHNSDYCHKPHESESDTGSWESSYYELFNGGVISQSLNLTSAYNQKKLDGSYEATTFQDYWVTVDYIYFSYCSTLRLLERLRLPTVSECDVLGRLPNDTYGSDHLALAAVFELTPCKSSL